MSLTLYLERHGTYDDGERFVTEVFDKNITHNLNGMARAAGVYECMWRPDEYGFKYAMEIKPFLEEGLARLEAAPAHYRQFDAPNGWGTYENLVEFVRELIEACEKYPKATLYACR